MTRRRGKRTAAEQKAFSMDSMWMKADLALLEELKQAEALLPTNAPRALLSVRLSVLTRDSTSPARQELDLRILARDLGCRVVGVASDLNVSATKVPPWKRKELGEWLNNRSPEFDVLLFWKLDRLVRRLSDLSTMIDWCLKYGKNLVSKNDTIDLTSMAGQPMVTLIGAIAEIEASTTSTRVASLWDCAKARPSWVIGKPAYGYVTDEDAFGKVVLRIDEDAHRVLHWCRRTAVRSKPASARRMAKVLVRSGLCGPGLTPSTLLRRLRNPALMGFRVEEDKNGGIRRSKLVLDNDREPIQVAEPIFTEGEFNELQRALDSRSKGQPKRQAGGATEFLGVLVCADCGTGMTVQNTRNKFGSYQYLRCRNCRSGGLGAPNPDEIYQQLIAEVLAVLGDEPVQTREYVRGAETRGHVSRLEDSISYYMKGLEPGGRFTKIRFVQERAEQALDTLITQLNAMDPDTAQDRWAHVPNGKTFRIRWEEGGMETMAADLVRAGVKCEITRTKVKGVRAPRVHMKLTIPKDLHERLILKDDHFA